MNLEKKQEEALTYADNVDRRVSELRAELEQLLAAKQQVIGRIQTYRELIQEAQNPTPPTEAPEDNVVDATVADEETAVA